MRSLNDVYHPEGRWLSADLNRRLFDLSAARYVVVDSSLDNTAVLSPPLRLVEDTSVRVYENPQALPRAAYVPRVEVVPDAKEILQRLASGPDDLQEVALVEDLPPSGFRGAPGNARGGSVQFVQDEPEHVSIRVLAPERGFLFLADQHFPGWRAAVNGVATPILRADYAFRLVEVPTGESAVDFRYSPASIRVGAWISGATALALVAGLLWPLARRRGRLTPAVPRTR